MSPVLSSNSATGFPVRRAPFTPATLFPVCPDRSPNTRIQELAPLSGPSSAVPDNRNADCPPRAPASCGQPLRNSQDLRRDAVFVANAEAGTAPNGAAPLVGI